MPKITGTRRQEAAELLQRLKAGPVNWPDRTITTEEASAHYDLWCSTWIIPVVQRLIPELKKKAQPK